MKQSDINKTAFNALNEAYKQGVQEGVDRMQRINVGLRTPPSMRKSVVKKLMNSLVIFSLEDMKQAFKAGGRAESYDKLNGWSVNLTFEDWLKENEG